MSSSEEITDKHSGKQMHRCCIWLRTRKHARTHTNTETITVTVVIAPIGTLYLTLMLHNGVTQTLVAETGRFNGCKSLVCCMIQMRLKTVYILCFLSLFILWLRPFFSFTVNCPLMIIQAEWVSRDKDLKCVLGKKIFLWRIWFVNLGRGDKVICVQTFPLNIHISWAKLLSALSQCIFQIIQSCFGNGLFRSGSRRIVTLWKS